VAAGREREVDVAVGAMEEVTVEFGSVPNGTERNISVCAPSVHPYSSVYSGGVMASSKNFMEIRESFIIGSSANEGATQLGRNIGDVTYVISLKLEPINGRAGTNGAICRIRRSVKIRILATSSSGVAFGDGNGACGIRNVALESDHVVYVDGKNDQVSNGIKAYRQVTRHTLFASTIRGMNPEPSTLIIIESISPSAFTTCKEPDENLRCISHWDMVACLPELESRCLSSKRKSG